MDFTVCQATIPDDLRHIDDFVYEQFIPDMPLINMFEIDPSSPRAALSSPHQPSSVSQDIYLKAVDSCGEMIGIALNKEEVHFETDSQTSPAWKRMVEFMEFVEEKSNISSLPGKTMELFILSVSSSWRQRGVARRLVEESVRLARGSGFETMTVFCGSEFTARLVKNLGWREHYRFPYKDYPNASGRDVHLQPIPPHLYAYFYIKDL